MPTFIGKPVTVAEDKQLQVGDTLRDFNLTTTDLTKKSLSEFDGKKKVISIVPSIDTGICSTQTRTFNKELSELDDTVVITISVDLPFAQARWCGAEGLENAIMLSDYYDNSFVQLLLLNCLVDFDILQIYHIIFVYFLDIHFLLICKFNLLERIQFIFTQSRHNLSVRLCLIAIQGQPVHITFYIQQHYPLRVQRVSNNCQNEDCRS